MTTIQSSQSENKAHRPIVNLKVLIAGPVGGTGIKDELLNLGYQIVYVTPQSSDKGDIQFNYQYLEHEITYANEHGFDLLLALDEHSNKMGVAVRKSVDQDFVALSPNQLAALFTNLWSRDQSMPTTFFKSIFLTDLVEVIATKNGQKCRHFLQDEDVEKFLTHDEEQSRIVFASDQRIYYSTKTFTQVIQDLLTWQQNLISEGRTLYDELIDLYVQYGFYKQKKFSIDYVSKNQQTHLLGTLDMVRKNPASIRERFSIHWIVDYKRRKAVNQLTGKVMPLEEEKSDVLKLDMTNGSSLIFVPSQEKMTYYICVKGGLQTSEGFEEESKKLNEQILKMMGIVNQLT